MSKGGCNSGSLTLEYHFQILRRRQFPDHLHEPCVVLEGGVALLKDSDLQLDGISMLIHELQALDMSFPPGEVVLIALHVPSSKEAIHNSHMFLRKTLPLQARDTCIGNIHLPIMLQAMSSLAKFSKEPLDLMA